MDFDVLFIGSGHGSDGATLLAQKGWKVGMIEKDLFGGTCTNRGCNAKITLERLPELKRNVENLIGKGVHDTFELDWTSIMAHKHKVIDGLNLQVKGKFEASGITTIIGNAKFIDPHTIQVDGKEIYTSEKIVIATGCTPNQLQLPGSEHFIDSTDFMLLENLPTNVTIIGGGFIAMEFACILQSLGRLVQVLLRGDKALKGFYQPHVEALLKNMEEKGISIFRNTQVSSAKKEHDKFSLTLQNGEILQTDMVLDATGRNPNIEGLGLETIGVDFSKDGILVDEYLETTVPGIFATGDVIAKSVPKITPIATFESFYLAKSFLNGKEKIEYPPFAQAVFSTPRIAQAGLSIATALENPEAYTLKEVDYVKEDWFHQVSNEPFNQLCLIYDTANKLVGVANIGSDAVETVNGMLHALGEGIHGKKPEDILYIFPSISHAYKKHL
ncbi:MAG: NAD(P)/FAD-dependent oxidoreductase [Streptococcaceae bacterium]|jgi:glutathione reductase (NADPH)|nr:NAD(P)/FAD-dependent oxidoreductase [Streptococcaceae bacterium]